MGGPPHPIGQHRMPHEPAAPHLDAVVFDFDGLIVDTETAIYQAAAAAFAAHGHDVSVEQWSSIVGLGDKDGAWYRALTADLGIDLDRDAFEIEYQKQDRSWRNRLPALPGVEALVLDLVDAGVPLAIASGSDVAWLELHLGRLGLLDHFPVLAGVDRVARQKPAPDAYLLACDELGADPARCVALEDSAHGVAAAKAAGLRVVAVPSSITRFTDLTAADLTVTSVEDVDLELLSGLVAPA